MDNKKTKYIKIDPAEPKGEQLRDAGQILRDGGLVAFPTETVYGLGANALNPEAASAIFQAKGRPSDNPLIVHICEFDQVNDLSDDIPEQARRVMEAFWPGPLTVVLPKQHQIPAAVTAGLNTVAVRMPDHPVALALLKAAGVPVAAPSANTSGKPSPTTADHVIRDLDGKIDMVVDGGACKVGLESTVLDMTAEPPVILRPGGITREELEGVLGHVGTDTVFYEAGSPVVPRSPGMKYKHYAPRADVVIVNGDNYSKIYEKVSELMSQFKSNNKLVGILASTETAGGYRADFVFPVGTREDLTTVAQNLFYGLRFLDDTGVNVIIAEGYPEGSIGTAIMNRLRKAAGNNVIEV